MIFDGLKKCASACGLIFAFSMALSGCGESAEDKLYEAYKCSKVATLLEREKEADAAQLNAEPYYSEAVGNSNPAYYFMQLSQRFQDDAPLYRLTVSSQMELLTEIYKSDSCQKLYRLSAATSSSSVQQGNYEQSAISVPSDGPMASDTIAPAASQSNEIEVSQPIQQAIPAMQDEIAQVSDNASVSPILSAGPSISYTVSSGSATDKIIVSISIKPATSVDVEVSARLIYQDGQVAGMQNANINADFDGITSITFSNANPWPSGWYEVGVFLNESLVGPKHRIEIR